MRVAVYVWEFNRSRGIGRVSEESGLSGGGVLGEKGVEELEFRLALSLSGNHEAWYDALREGAYRGSSSKGNLSHDDLRSKRLFCLVIGGLDSRDSEESKKAAMVLDQYAVAESFGRLIVEWLWGLGSWGLEGD